MAATKKTTKAVVDAESDRPKRPLSAYNVFFKQERENMLRTIQAEDGQYDHSLHSTVKNDPSTRRDRSKKTRPPPHRKIGFAEMARTIASKWKSLDPTTRKHFDSLAIADKERYNKDMEEWRARHGIEEVKKKGRKKTTSRSTATVKKRPKKVKGDAKHARKAVQGEAKDISHRRNAPPLDSPAPDEMFSAFPSYLEGDSITEFPPTYEFNAARMKTASVNRKHPGFTFVASATSHQDDHPSYTDFLPPPNATRNRKSTEVATRAYSTNIPVVPRLDNYTELRATKVMEKARPDTFAIRSDSMAIKSSMQSDYTHPHKASVSRRSPPSISPSKVPKWNASDSDQLLKALDF